MPTLVIQERQTVDYDFLLEYDADFVRAWPLKVISPRGILRSGTYEHSGGTLVVQKNQRAEVVFHVKGIKTCGAPALVGVYVKIVNEPMIPERRCANVFGNQFPLKRFTEVK